MPNSANTNLPLPVMPRHSAQVHAHRQNDVISFQRGAGGGLCSDAADRPRLGDFARQHALNPGIESIPVVAFIACVAALALPLAAQTGEAPPRFEVASVKPTQHGRNAEGLSISSDPETPSPGSFRATNNSLGELIRWAYQVKRYQVVGPNWLDEDPECFDIEARMDPGTSRPQVRLMLRALLAERFKLALHRETRIFPVYELIVAKNGPRLAPVKADAKGGLSYDGKFWSTLTAEKTTAARLASFLSDRLEHPVIDKTGIATQFPVNLEYRIADDDERHPSLFTALQESLGLKLQPGKGSVEVLVIDHIEKAPAEN